MCIRDRAAHRQAALLAERDQLFHDRAQFLRLRQRGDDLLVLDQRRAHIGEHRAPMFGGAIELAMNLAVTHGIFLSTYSVATARRTRCSGGPPAFAPVIPDVAKRRSGISRFSGAQWRTIVRASARPGMTKSIMILEALG